MDFFFPTAGNITANPPALAGNVTASPYAMDNASWTKGNMTITANAAVAPDGSSNADLCVPTTTNAGHTISDGSLTTTADPIWVLRGRFKNRGWDQIELIIGSTAAYAKFITAMIDLAKGQVTQYRSTTYTGYTRMWRLPADWWMVDLYVFNPDANGTHRVDVSPYLNNAVSFPGDGVGGFYAWGVEFGPVPT